MSDLDDFNRLIGYWRAYGLSEEQANAKAESEMEAHERNYDHANCHLCEVFLRKPTRDVHRGSVPDL